MPMGRSMRSERSVRWNNPHLDRPQYRYLSPYLEAQPTVRLPYGGLHLGWRLAPREDEAEVAGSLRQRHERIIHLGGNLYPCHQWHLQGFLDAVHPLENTGGRDRDHHHTGSPRLAFDRGDPLSGGMAQDQFLQAHAGAKFQDGRTKSADRTPRHL